MRDRLARGRDRRHAARRQFGLWPGRERFARSVRGTCSSPCAASITTRTISSPMLQRAAPRCAGQPSRVGSHRAGGRARGARGPDSVRTRMPGVSGRRRGHHRQQRQDHGQGDDGGDPRIAEAAWLPAATSTTTSVCRSPRAARVRASLCRDRDGRESPGRDRAPRIVAAPGVGLVINAGPRTWKGSAVSTRSPERRASSSSWARRTAP